MSAVVVEVYDVGYGEETFCKQYRDEGLQAHAKSFYFESEKKPNAKRNKSNKGFYLAQNFASISEDCAISSLS